MARLAGLSVVRASYLRISPKNERREMLPTRKAPGVSTRFRFPLSSDSLRRRLRLVIVRAATCASGTVLRLRHQRCSARSTRHAGWFNDVGRRPVDGTLSSLSKEVSSATAWTGTNEQSRPAPGAWSSPLPARRWQTGSRAGLGPTAGSPSAARRGRAGPPSRGGRAGIMAEARPWSG